MKTMMKYFWLISVVLVLSGCETTNSIPYKASTDNVINMQQILNSTGEKLKLGEFTISPEAEGNLLCRLMGPVTVAPGKSLQEYIKEAFQEELFLAQVYNVDANTTLTGNVDELTFSSISPAYWDIAMTISNQNGTSYQVSTKYNFSTSYSAYSACKNVADAFGPTVQQLIKSVVTHPEFRSLVNEDQKLGRR